MALIRVVAEHAPNLLMMLGLYAEETLESSLTMVEAGTPTPITYYRVVTKPDFYALYRRAIQGGLAPGHELKPGQQ